MGEVGFEDLGEAPELLLSPGDDDDSLGLKKSKRCNETSRPRKGWLTDRLVSVKDARDTVILLGDECKEEGTKAASTLLQYPS